MKTRIINDDKDDNILINKFLLIKFSNNKKGIAITAYSEAKFLILNVEPGLKLNWKLKMLILKNSKIPSNETIVQTHETMIEI
jgi:hypothetical protein